MGEIMNLSRKFWFVGLVLLAIFIQPVFPSQAGTFYDKFDDNFLNPIWEYEIYGPGPTVAEVNNRLEITIPEVIILTTSTDIFLGVWLVPKFFINGDFGMKGDFDEQVDFNLLNWPAGTGLTITLSGSMQFHIGRTWGPWQQEYYVWCLGGAIASVETTGTSGKLRLKRIGNKMEGFYWKNNAWELLGSHTDPSFGGQDEVGIAVGQNGPFSNRGAKIGLNNYQLTNQYICNGLPFLFLLFD
jgi:hypothetical protein